MPIFKYKSLLKQSSGFTLVELLVVISIILIITGTMIPAFNVYTDSQNVKQAQERLKSDIKTLQIRALTESSNAQTTQDIQYWVLKFNQARSKSYEYYTTAIDVTNFSSSDLQTVCNNALSQMSLIDSSSNLPSNTEVITGVAGRNAPRCLFFSTKNADMVTTPTTTTCSGVADAETCLKVSNDGATDTSCKLVGLNSYGLVKLGASEVLCD